MRQFKISFDKIWVVLGILGLFVLAGSELFAEVIDRPPYDRARSEPIIEEVLSESGEPCFMISGLDKGFVGMEGRLDEVHQILLAATGNVDTLQQAERDRLAMEVELLRYERLEEEIKALKAMIEEERARREAVEREAEETSEVVEQAIEYRSQQRAKARGIIEEQRAKKGDF